MNLKTAAPALVIFVVCIITRAILQGLNVSGDVTWITTFGAIGASWLGIGGQIADVAKRTHKIDNQTRNNGTELQKIRKEDDHG